MLRSEHAAARSSWKDAAAKAATARADSRRDRRGRCSCGKDEPVTMMPKFEVKKEKITELQIQIQEKEYGRSPARKRSSSRPTWTRPLKLEGSQDAAFHPRRTSRPT